MGKKNILAILLVCLFCLIAMTAAVGQVASSDQPAAAGAATLFFEMLLFILAGQYLHVLIKMKSARKQFGDKYKNSIFFEQNKINLTINGSLILILSAILARAGFPVVIEGVKATVKPLEFFGISIPGDLWLGLVVYAAYITAGYFIQSLFYWMMKGGLKKANIEVIEEEKETP